MADSKRPALTGTPVGRRTFSTAFRGFDQEEVRAYLEALAFEFRDLRDRIAELEAELTVERARTVTTDTPRLDVATITTALGEETARVLRTAQEAADDLRSRAEEGAARTLKEAHDEAARLRTAAEGVLAERTAEAEAEAARIRSDAEEEVAKRRADATAEAEATVAQAIEQGRDMLSQAQAARERVLSDLSRRRKIGLGQLDQLRAGRERLHTSLRAARGELDRIMEDLSQSDEEARLAEEAVGHAPAKTPTPPDEPEEHEVVVKAEQAGAPEEAAAPATEEPTAAVAEEPGEAPTTPGTAEEVGAVDAGAAAPASDDTGPTAPPASDEPAATTPAAVEAAAAEAPTEGDDAGAAPAATGARSPKSRSRTSYRHDRVPAGLLPAEAVGGPGDEERPSGRVDELFARIRSDRAQKVEAARAVLATPEPTQEDAAEAPAERASDDPGLEAPRTDADESYLQRRDALLEQALASTLRAVKRGLADDQNIALERLRTVRTAAVTVDALLDDGAAYLERATAWAADGLGSCSTAGSVLAGGEEAPLAADLVAPIAASLAAGLVEPVRQRLAEVLESSGGDRGPDTVDRINSIYREARGRVDRLVGDAVTEVVSRAFAAALADGTPVRWVVEDVDGPCPDCDDNALAGAIALGQPFPTGQLAPPAHPGCRCVLSPTPT